MSTIVSNTSPLISLSAIGQFDLLGRIFSRVLIPEAVRDEIAAGDSPHHIAVDLEQGIQVGWLTLVSSPSAPALARLRRDLGAGEVEAIAVAQARNLPVLIDDLPARKAAVDLNLNLTGTLGVLALAKKRRMIPDVTTPVRHLLDAGIRYSPNLIADFLHGMGEG